MVGDRIVTLAMSLSLAACGGPSPQDFLQPQVNLRQIGLRSVGVAGGTLDVQLAIANPNRIQVKGTQVSAALDVQGSHFGDIASTDPFTLTEQDTTLITLPLTFRWAGLTSAARSILDYGEVNYGLWGKLSVETPVGQPLEVPFNRTGAVPVVKTVTGAP